MVVLRYYLLGGLKFRKYNKSIVNALKLRLFRACLSVDIKDCKWLGPYSNAFLINRMIPLVNRPLVSDLPGYGTKFDANSLWIAKSADRKSLDPVIIYAHGGGYFIQTMPSQIQGLVAMYRLLDPEKQRKTSVLFLDYKLVSKGHPFPTQINQLHETYLKLVEEGNSNIVLMGDSAGGHLAVAYTQFLKQLTPAPSKVVYPRQLVLVSPWVKLNPLPADLAAGKSWKDNEHYDMIHHSKFANFSDMCLIVGVENPFSLVVSPGGKQPADRSDWSDIPTFSDPNYSVFIVAGEDESFRDDIVQWAHYSLGLPWHEKVKYGNLHEVFEKEHYEFSRRKVKGQANLTAYIEPLGVHDSTFFFENTICYKIASNLKKSLPNNVEDFSDETYFGITRIVRFLNETL